MQKALSGFLDIQPLAKVLKSSGFE